VDFLGSAGPDDQLVAVAKARVVIPDDNGTATEWTFGVHSDDGVALRVDGAVFKRVSGDSWIDAADRSTVYFRAGTGDSNIRAVCDLAPGEHDIEFIWFEGTGGANFELYAAAGGFNNDADTATWRLVGDTANGGLALVAASVPPVNSDFQITSVSYNAATSMATVTFPSEAGAQYRLEWSSTLTDNPWPTASTVTGTAGATTTTVNTATLNGGTAPQRFFVRVREL
jgi:hypothetical protein